MSMDLVQENAKLRSVISTFEAMFRAREPMPGTHLRADGSPCTYLHDGKVCNKCGFMVRATLASQEKEGE